MSAPPWLDCALAARPIGTMSRPPVRALIVMESLVAATGMRAPLLKPALARHLPTRPAAVDERKKNAVTLASNWD